MKNIQIIIYSYLAFLSGIFAQENASTISMSNVLNPRSDFQFMKKGVFKELGIDYSQVVFVVLHIDHSSRQCRVFGVIRSKDSKNFQYLYTHKDREVEIISEVKAEEYRKLFEKYIISAEAGIQEKNYFRNDESGDDAWHPNVYLIITAARGPLEGIKLINPKNKTKTGLLASEIKKMFTKYEVKSKTIESLINWNFE